MSSPVPLRTRLRTGLSLGRRFVRRLRRPAVTADTFLAVEPLSRTWGLDRGTPIDRHYTEAFLQAHAADIRGRVLETADPRYTKRFGGSAVTRSDVLHLTADNPVATVVGDLTSGEGIPRGAFDTFIAVNTFRLIYDVTAAIRTCHDALAPGGVLLASFDALASRCPDTPDWEGDFWRFTTASVRRLLGTVFDPEAITITARGNVRAGTGVLYGLAVEDLDPAVLEVDDPNIEVMILVRAVK